MEHGTASDPFGVQILLFTRAQAGKILISIYNL